MSTASAGGHTLSFEYNGDGIRTAKTADGVKHVYITGDNRLLQETWGSNKIEYLYDDTGTIFGLYYNGAKFYLIKNLQGDVVELRNSTNGLVARYTYDAYGKCTSVRDSSGAEITDASNIALINPIRYRGYYFDSETGLYFVSSRYYDPEIGRWINADNAIPSTSESVQGYNLFAYCFNNPVNMDDHSGHWPKWLKNVVKAVASVVTRVKAVLSIPSTVVKIAAASTVAVVSKQATVGDVVNDVKDYSFSNTNETKVLNAKVFSSYKGTPVIKHDISGVTSFSVSNTIILNKGETVSNGGVDAVKHEWGHTVQQSLIGTQKYMTRIAAPSVISCIVNPSSKTYYSLPWERTADFFGGASRTTGYYAGSDVVAGLYLIMP